MQAEIIINGGVSLLLSPENPLEEEALKALCKQNNDLTEIRTTVVILNKTLRNGVLIAKKPVLKPADATPAKNGQSVANEN